MLGTSPGGAPTHVSIPNDMSVEGHGDVCDISVVTDHSSMSLRNCISTEICGDVYTHACAYIYA